MTQNQMLRRQPEGNWSYQYFSGSKECRAKRATIAAVGLLWDESDLGVLAANVTKLFGMIRASRFAISAYEAIARSRPR